MGVLRGRRSKYAGMIIRKLVTKNPRRKKQGKGYLAFENVYDGITYEEYALKGGRSNDLAYDIKKGHLAVEAPK